MSDPQRHPHDQPRGASPLHPNKPGGGDQTASSARAHVDPASTRKAVQQESAAVDNAREGYA